jgi:hypothetical protein
MQLGRTLLGGVIGAVVGIAVLVGVYFAFGIDKVWMALPVAILTGLGVRMMVSTWGHASYLRGAITGALALGAYLLGSYVVAGIAQQRASAAGQATRIEQPAAIEKADDAADDADDAGEEATEPAMAATDQPRPRPASAGSGAQRPVMPKTFSALDFVVLCVSALVAYELGRGTAAKPVVVVGEETATDVPPGTHPDA